MFFFTGYLAKAVHQNDLRETQDYATRTMTFFTFFTHVTIC